MSRTGHWAIYNYIIRDINNLSSEQVTRLLFSRSYDQTGQQDNYNLRLRQTHYRSCCVTISFLFFKFYENNTPVIPLQPAPAPRRPVKLYNRAIIRTE